MTEKNEKECNLKVKVYPSGTRIIKNPKFTEAIKEEFNKAIPDETVKKLYEAMKKL